MALSEFPASGKDDERSHCSLPSFEAPMQITSKQKVSFQRDNLKLVGHLFTPTDFDNTLKYPALICQGSVSSVKEMMPDNYARLLAREGFVVLSFDYASYGESEGVPRKNENVASKLKDLQSAVSYLQTLPFVGRIGMVGICTSGGNAAYLAASDDRLSALATVVPWMYEPALAEPFWGKETLETNRNRAEGARQRFEQTGEFLTTQIFTNTPDVEGFNLTPGEYYFDLHRGGAIANWKNEIFWGAWDEWVEVFDPISQAPKIKIPVLVFSTDDALIPAQARKFYDLVQSEKELVWSEGYHFNFYDVAPEMYKAVDAVVPFMQKHLT
ncbi:alpha/beta hydrolase [Leptolyngbya sp. FACHB-261]|uniref:alpha/beta hydrolase n=1 Tax=Leptolyngbya sp. FACHB-261 TaxID=2692806 RepID=UPI0016881B22|nr:alpha/beta hydrolase [Leptolyngbya sp. FACHB-261]MBD2100984.1 alpha/beta hydrolase [Leptolyngbya sp. FACHB-261]